jgi:integrase
LIYQRTDGYWCANVSAGYSDIGMRRLKTVYGATKGEVQGKLRQIAIEVASGSPVEAQKLTLAEFLDRWLATIKQSIAPSTHARYKADMRLVSALQHAVKLGLVRSNAARENDRPTVPKPELKCWTTVDVATFLKTAKTDRLSALYVLALSSGMRQGELLGLQWGDVDFAAGVVTV